jgi:predicted dehydrogenase
MTPPALGGRIRIGILGCAEIARRSMIPAILSLRDRFELVAVASRDRAKAEAFASRFDCRAVVGYEPLLRPELVDAVYVPLPSGLHPEWVGRALETGLHVYAEKSLALRFEQAREMVSQASSPD